MAMIYASCWRRKVLKEDQSKVTDNFGESGPAVCTHALSRLQETERSFPEVSPQPSPPSLPRAFLQRLSLSSVLDSCTGRGPGPHVS